MRLVTWNCKGGFARKHVAIAALKPHVLVVPESERLESIDNVLDSQALRSVEWVGENPRKGLAVLSYGDYALEVHEAYDPSHHWILPLKVNGPNPFTLFAVWTVPHRESGLYVQCLFEAIETYRDILATSKVVWAGDFNSNFQLDHYSSTLKFSELVTQLSSQGLQSLYHLQTGCEHGGETQNTFFLHHNAEKGHHIDFIFAKPALYSRGFEISIGEHSRWSKISDHMPMTCSFQLEHGYDA